MPAEVRHPRAILAIAACALACGGDRTVDETLDADYPFIASASDFDGFHAWKSFALTSDLAPGDTHINGPRHVFINQVPPKGSKKFPVGTILVKETDPGPATRRTVFASVKRGGNFDPTGDVGWEWFSLQNLPDGTERILWRGAGPASGGVYGPGPLGGCNQCHGSAALYDYALTIPVEEMLSVPGEPWGGEAGAGDAPE